MSIHLIRIGPLSLAVLCSCAMGPPEGPGHDEEAVEVATVCPPSSREAEEMRIAVPYGTWQISFKARVIPCAAIGRPLTEQEVQVLKDEFTEPTKWTNLQLVREAEAEEFRRRAVERVNEVLGSRLVSDIVFDDIVVDDGYGAAAPGGR